MIMILWWKNSSNMGWWTSLRIMQNTLHHFNTEKHDCNNSIVAIIWRIKVNVKQDIIINKKRFGYKKGGKKGEETFSTQSHNKKKTREKLYL